MSFEYIKTTVYSSLKPYVVMIGLAFIKILKQKGNLTVVLKL